MTTNPTPTTTTERVIAVLRWRGTDGTEHSISATTGMHRGHTVRRDGTQTITNNADAISAIVEMLAALDHEVLERVIAEATAWLDTKCHHAWTRQAERLGDPCPYCAGEETTLRAAAEAAAD